MIKVERTVVFGEWLEGLKDRRGVARILGRIERLEAGNPGDAEPVGEGVSELRIHYGPGYRVYYFEVRRGVVILLCGGDKSTQSRDIERAKKLAKQLRQ